MKKDSNPHTSQDYDRHHGQNHISKNPPAKDFSATNDAIPEDKRKEARQEHTNHFTNREGHGEKK